MGQVENLPGHEQRRAVLAVDGGGSKTDVVVIAENGQILGHARGSGTNPQVRGWGRVRPELDRLRDTAIAEAEVTDIVATHVYLSGLDLPEELRIGRRELAHWGDLGISPNVLDNDLFALLRSATLRPRAVVVVCGTGINAMGVDGEEAVVRFPALGPISGDWGGGSHLGQLALWSAARADDGRGRETRLLEEVPKELGYGSIRDVIEAIHFERIPESVVTNLAPLVFRLASEGDPVCVDLVAKLTAEIVTLARICIQKMHVENEEIPLILGGGILAAQPTALVEAVTEGIRQVAPRAEIEWVKTPPVLGAGLAALASVGASPEAIERFHHEIDEKFLAPVRGSDAAHAEGNMPCAS